MKTAHLKNSYKKVTKKQAINKLAQGSVIGAFDLKDNYGFGYIIDDFEDIKDFYSFEKYKKIIELNMDNYVSGSLENYSYFEII